jgi:crossover junction endodeoxyribonuclease RuvC
MRILGIDPGLRLTGYGCVELPVGASEPALVEAGVFRLKQNAPLPERLKQLDEDLASVIEELAPRHIVVEQLFSHYKHVRTAILMAHARGVVVAAGAKAGLTFDELAPTEVKKAITGNGHATKRQMQQAVTAQCGLDEIPEPPDVADAIAIALCAARRIVAERLANPLPTGESHHG